MTIGDQFIGLEIFSAQKKLEEYKEIFNELVNPNCPFQMDKMMCEELGRTMVKFQSDEHQAEVLQMCDVI